MSLSFVWTPTDEPEPHALIPGPLTTPTDPPAAPREKQQNPHGQIHALITHATRVDSARLGSVLVSLPVPRGKRWLVGGRLEDETLNSWKRKNFLLRQKEESAESW